MRLQIGKKSVIRCWDEGLVGLRAGSKATLVCPPSHAYGDREMGKIPPNSALIFNVEIISIEPYQAAEPAK